MEKKCIYALHARLRSAQVCCKYFKVLFPTSFAWLSLTLPLTSDYNDTLE